VSTAKKIAARNTKRKVNSVADALKSNFQSGVRPQISEDFVQISGNSNQSQVNCSGLLAIAV
jgi:hypothetical protein